ncbi:MAG: PAS domain S-box protein [Thermodesulfobacteriota bacterium]|nr:PAS domain S-box protein [Thermodesulfobacteriota bacterium]
MKKENGRSYKQELRRQAKVFIQKNHEEVMPVDQKNIQRMIEDLQIHQVELELQNDELQRIQLELEEARDRYFRLYDFAPIGYFTISDKGMILEANLTGAEMVHKERELLIGRPFFRFIHRDDRDLFYIHIQKLFRTKARQRCELRLLKLNGSEFYVQLESTVAHDLSGHTKCLWTAVSNIHERKEVESRLEKSEERYHDLYENAPDIYFTVAQDGTILSINRFGADYIGYCRDELPGRPLWSIVHGDHIEALQKQVSDLFHKREQTMELAFHVVRRDGSLLWIHGRTLLMIDETGSSNRLLLICRDISGQKAAEEERMEMERQLQEIQKMESIKTLAGGIAHEFNNALCGISGNIDLLHMKLPQDKDIFEYIEGIKASTARMSDLTSQLLAYARRGKYQPRSTSINDIVTDTVSLIKRNINPTIQFETVLTKDIPNISADFGQMQMAISDVLYNASEAIQNQGCIRIVTSVEEADEAFVKYHHTLTPGLYTCLTIEDNGRGMNEETQNRIFEPFFSTKFEGRGLGMASVYGIVKNHNGWISVYSHEGKGTAVKIYLPAIETVVKRAKKPETDMDFARVGTVLVIEDEEVVMEVTREMLEELGHSVLEARTGNEAIDIVLNFESDIDLALLDIKLPDMDGGEIYPFIKEARPKMKVLVCSGYALNGPIEEILASGAQGFIQKPFSFATLREKLKEVL